MGKYSQKSAKKPITKRWWFWVLVVFFAVGIIGNLAGFGDDSSDTATTIAPTTVQTTTITTAETTAATETETQTVSALPFNVNFSADFRNDTTGRWRKALVATSETIDKYAVDYYKEYFAADDEVHVIYNFTLNTVNCLTVQAGTLFVNITEYVKGEEHDAAKACGGQYLGQCQFDISTGEMTYDSFNQ